jgi:hypothetical protein
MNIILKVTVKKCETYSKANGILMLTVAVRNEICI